MMGERHDIDFDDDEPEGELGSELEGSVDHELDGDELDGELADESMRVGRLEELESDEDDVFVDLVAEARSRLSVEEIMQQLVAGRNQLSVRDLFVFSDLSRPESELVAAQWPDVSAAGRRRVVAELNESADEHLELQLGRFLRIALRDSDAEVRRLAINGLWEEVDADLIGPFIQAMQSDPDVGVRAAAAAALGAFVLAGELDELDAALAIRVEQALLAVLHESREPLAVQCRALESLAYSGEAGLRQLIEDAYYAPEEQMRLSAVRAMGRSADTRWRGMVRAELKSPEPAMRAEAARACGELEVKAAAPRLIEMLEDSDLLVRLAAIEALGHLGGKPARDALRALAAEGDVEEAEAAEEALDEMLFYDEPGAEPLLDTADEDEDDEVEPWHRRSPDEWDG